MVKVPAIPTIDGWKAVVLDPNNHQKTLFRNIVAYEQKEQGFDSELNLRQPGEVIEEVQTPVMPIDIEALGGSSQTSSIEAPIHTHALKETKRTETGDEGDEVECNEHKHTKLE